MDKIIVDSDMREMLNELMRLYKIDEAHLIRALLRQQIKRIDDVRTLD